MLCPSRKTRQKRKLLCLQQKSRADGVWKHQKTRMVLPPSGPSPHRLLGRLEMGDEAMGVTHRRQSTASLQIRLGRGVRLPYVVRALLCAFCALMMGREVGEDSGPPRLEHPWVIGGIRR